MTDHNPVDRHHGRDDGATASTAVASGELGSGRTGTMQAQPNLAFSIKPPRLFDNKKETNFKQWVNRLDTYFELVGMSPQNRTGILLLNLSSEICYTARCLGVTADMAYDEASRRLNAHFSPIETVEESRAQFQVRVQELDEPVETFGRELRVLAAKAFPNPDEGMLQTLMVTQFVNGLRDADTRARLILRRCKDLNDTVSAARLSEVANKSVRGSKTSAVFAVGGTRVSSPTSNVRFDSQRVMAPVSEVSFQRQRWDAPNRQPQYGNRYNAREFRPQLRYGGFSVNSTSARDYGRSEFQGKCYNCQCFGHRARECPNAAAKNYSNRGFVQQSQWRPQRDRSSSRESSHPGESSRERQSVRRNSPYPNGANVVIEACNSVGMGQAAKTSLFVEGHLRGELITNMLLDTGSVISIMSERVWNRIKRERNNKAHTAEASIQCGK